MGSSPWLQIACTLRSDIGCHLNPKDFQRCGLHYSNSLCIWVMTSVGPKVSYSCHTDSVMLRPMCLRLLRTLLDVALSIEGWPQDISHPQQSND
ncbi:hypothetical protein Mapa_003041 [Marchantia paleacea]|nr:hypothetical protein Mapa_003041 [Marchantia paleacea]